MEILERNPKLGYYTVGDTIFYSKIEALKVSTNTGVFPKWHFNQEVFDSINTAIEPEIGLQQLYKIRAQQLRDRYDYLRLEFSGGSDSATILYSFINNGIHLDEIVCRFPKQGSNGLGADAKNTNSENILSEFEFAAKPILQYVATHYPEIKITIHDFSENIINYKGDESWIYSAKDYLHAEHTFKHDPLSTKEHLSQAEGGKRIAIIYGIDKPKICIKDGRWCFYFMDIMASHAQNVTARYNNISTEYFYWQPDLPEIVIKQAHIVKNWFMLPQNQHLQFLLRWPNHSISNRTTVESIIKPLIYPDYDSTTFQVSKPTSNFYAEMSYWFFKNLSETHFHQVWQAGISYVVKTIDPKFFTYKLGKPVGFVGFLSPFYYLGESNFVNNDSIKELAE
jgi:hypothetical protein